MKQPLTLIATVVLLLSGACKKNDVRPGDANIPQIPKATLVFNNTGQLNLTYSTWLEEYENIPNEIDSFLVYKLTLKGTVTDSRQNEWDVNLETIAMTNTIGYPLGPFKTTLRLTEKGAADNWISLSRVDVNFLELYERGQIAVFLDDCFFEKGSGKYFYLQPPQSKFYINGVFDPMSQSAEVTLQGELVL
jgi:hypothetical protein